MAFMRNVMVLGLLEEQTLNVTVDAPLSVGQIKEYFKQRKCVDWSLFSLTRGGIVLSDDDTIGDSNVTVIHAHPLVKGGKGGFGSLIRAMGSQINKSTNKEACRNLSGRRVRDINAEKKLAKWASGEAERKRKEAEEKQQRLERKRAGPKHNFDDTSYMEQIKSSEEEMGGALKQGLEASSSKGKSKAVEMDRPSKRPKLWLGVDEEWSDSDGEEEQHALESDQCLERESCPPDETQTTVKESDAAQSSSSAGVLIGSPKDEVASANESSPSHSCSTKDVDTDTTAVHVQDKNGECQADTSKCQEPIDLDAYESAEALVSVGGERLKFALQSLGLKCGGTPMERALRLYSTKGKTKDQYDSSLFAKPKKSKSKHK